MSILRIWSKELPKPLIIRGRTTDSSFMFSKRVLVFSMFARLIRSSIDEALSAKSAAALFTACVSFVAIAVKTSPFTLRTSETKSSVLAKKSFCLVNSVTACHDNPDIIKRRIMRQLKDAINLLESFI